MITLREDQIEAVTNIRAALKQHQSIIYRGECGSGKTVIASYMALGAQQKKKRVIFGVHRKELLRQTAKTFDQFGIKYGYIAHGHAYNPFALVQIASADTLRSRHNMLDCDLFCPDEAHLWASKTRLEIINEVKGRGAHIVNLTATPMRGNGDGLGSIASHIVEGPVASWLMERGDLARYKAYAPSTLDMSGVRKTGAEWSPSSMDDKFNKPYIYGDKIDAYKRRAFGKRFIGYCHSRENGIETAAAFREAGIPAVFIDGETSDNDRRNAILGFANGDHILLNCQLMREGFDLSAQVGRRVPIQAGGLWTPSQSFPMARQMMFRPLRPQDGYASLIDQAGIFAQHGFPDDEVEFSLDGGGPKKSDGEATIPLCKCARCHYSQRAVFTCCPDCGAEREVNGREIASVDAEIAEIDVEAMRLQKHHEFVAARIQERECVTLEDWRKLAKQRGYAPGWAFHRHKLAIAKGKRA